MRHILYSIILSLLLVVGCGRSSETTRIVEDFNFDWSFALGDNRAYSSPDYDDNNWRQLHLPHDWSIEGEFKHTNPATAMGGALPTGIGWYRKSFETPNIKDKRVFIEFDGIYQNSTVYVNGTEVGHRPNGYVSMSYDITEHLNPEGHENIIAVRCDNSLQPASRWYTGCGIYRNVRLVTTSEVHVEYLGTRITSSNLSKESATVYAVVTITNHSAEDKKITLNNTILNARDKFECSRETTTTVKAGESVDVEMGIYLEAPTYWDTTNPYLYTMRSTVELNGKAIDEYRTRFGIRHVEFKADSGFWLNGRNVKLNGVCLHHDMGALGSAVHRRALMRQLEILQSAGVNAIRTAHNPPSPELLDLCDERGILVIDEAFDVWRMGKVKYDYSRYFDKWHEQDLTNMIKRDRNHPSIIVWSLGNAVHEQLDYGKRVSDAEQNPNVQLSRNLAEIVRRNDDSRPISAACNNIGKNNNLLRSGALDIVGISYNETLYDSVRVWYPDLAIIAMESASVQNSKKPWITGHEQALVASRDNAYCAGTFIWSGFDYLGEPTPQRWPARSSSFGIVDLAGFPKETYYMYRAEWTQEPTLQLYPHWTHKEGSKIDIRAYYNNADEVELLRNGESLGRSAKDSTRLHALWEGIEFEAGDITAIAYKDGKEVMRHTHNTASEPVMLNLNIDREIINADGYDLAYVTIECIDSNGNIVPTATNQLYIDIEGAGELIGIDNGNASGSESLKGSKIKLHNGRALVIVRSLRDIPGDIRLRVRCEEIYNAEMIITSR